MKKLLTILGPTATGNKDLEDYVVDGQPVPYHLIDIAEPGTKYNLFQYQQDFHRAYDDIQRRGALPILCGGTGLYIEAVLKGYALSPVPQNPTLRQSLEGKTLEELTDMLVNLKQQTGSTMHNKTDVDSCQRAIRAIEIETYNLEHPTGLRQMPPVDSVVIGVAIDRDERRRRITARLHQRLEHGMVEEIRRLLDGMERRGTLIHWVDAMLPMEEKVKRVEEIYQSANL